VRGSGSEWRVEWEEEAEGRGGGHFGRRSGRERDEWRRRRPPELPARDERRGWVAAAGVVPLVRSSSDQFARRLGGFHSLSGPGQLGLPTSGMAIF
jgi:hypothetical protein